MQLVQDDFGILFSEYLNNKIVPIANDINRSTYVNRRYPEDRWTAQKD